MRTNNKAVYNGPTTHEGAIAAKATPLQQLRHTLLACLLWEDNFYEDGVSVAERIASLVSQVETSDLVDLAVEARTRMKLRHVPLWLARCMAKDSKHRPAVGKLLPRIIQRPDELTEFLALYWKNGKEPLAAQVKKGLAAAIGQFNEYNLAKYDRDAEVKLRDVLFLCHAKPKDAGARFTRLERKEVANGKYGRDLSDGEALFARIVNRTLQTPDTWEVRLSAGEDKAASFRALMAEKTLGALAFLRNLRTMQEAGIQIDELRSYLAVLPVGRVLPFRFIAAARFAPHLEPALEEAMFRCLQEHEKLAGVTHLLVDVSGSMDAPLSQKSDMRRLDAACGLAMLLRETGDVYVHTFSNALVSVPPRRGFALRDAIVQSQPHGGTALGGAVKALIERVRGERLIVITDEQSADVVPNPQAAFKRSYMLNVASYENGVSAAGDWVRISGWSEAIVDYILALESAR
jgi:hypothetical protein